MKIGMLSVSHLTAILCRHKLMVPAYAVILMTVILLLLRYHHIIKVNAKTVFMHENGEVRSRLYARSEHVRQMCPTVDTSDIDQNLVYGVNVRQNQEHKFVYCGVQKVGSTFWRRVLLNLNKTMERNNIFDIPFYAAHQGSYSREMLLYPENAEEILATYTKFMFTREPFSRLYSAYVDKIMLPSISGNNITQTIKEWAGDKSCELFVSFPVFCDYVATSILDRQSMDIHLTPMYQHCDPCHLNFTLIGKMETFAEDTAEIFKILDIDTGHYTGGIDDVGKANDLHLIFDLTFRTYSTMQFSWNGFGCTTQIQILHRLWKALQIRGILSKTIPPPQWGRDGAAIQWVPMQTFYVSVLTAYTASGDRKLRQSQKKESMQEAYRTVPRSILENVSRAFATDCILFDYSCDVAEIFTM